MTTNALSLNRAVQAAAADTMIADGSEPLAGWRLIRRLTRTRWFDLFMAAPATCDPDWPADYVVKVVRANADPWPMAIGWLRREAEVARRVCHPHLATVLVDHSDGALPFVVQPYYEGSTLADWFRREVSVPLSDVLWAARQVAEALTALHQAGWLHGDVKPAHIIVSPLGHATLVDLGFARRLAEHRTSSADRLLQHTVGYAAPELYLDDCPITSAADIYSLGVCLYEALSGERLFPGTTLQDTIRAHLENIPVDLRKQNPLLPTDVSRLVMRMLAKDPTARPAASTVVEELVRAEIECFDTLDMEICRNPMLRPCHLR